MTEDQKKIQPDNIDAEQKEKEGAKAEGFIISNSNGNGINPNPLESGNAPEWDKGTDQSEQYKSDSTEE